jgi:hypothetical protein
MRTLLQKIMTNVMQIIDFEFSKHALNSVGPTNQAHRAPSVCLSTPRAPAERTQSVRIPSPPSAVRAVRAGSERGAFGSEGGSKVAHCAPPKDLRGAAGAAPAGGRLKIVLTGRIKGVDKAKKLVVQTEITSRELTPPPLAPRPPAGGPHGGGAGRGRNAVEGDPEGVPPKAAGGGTGREADAARASRKARAAMGRAREAAGGPMAHGARSVLRPQSIDVPGGLKGKLDYASKGIYTK